MNWGDLGSALKQAEVRGKRDHDIIESATYKGFSLNCSDWKFTSLPLLDIHAFFTHHPACLAVDYRGACDCAYIKRLWGAVQARNESL